MQGTAYFKVGMYLFFKKYFMVAFRSFNILAQLTFKITEEVLIQWKLVILDSINLDESKKFNCPQYIFM